MGIEEIVDNQGYLEAMAAPQIAAVKRDATVAEAEAEREARIRAAAATREAEQAELDAQRETLAQSEALQLREVEVQRRVDIERAESDQEVQQKRALAVEQQQEADVLVPARAEREATEIRAEASRRKMTIEAEADATAIRERAEADATATEQRGRADAAALQARELAQAEGEKAKLLAEAEGRRELAAATAAEDSINLRQFIIEQVTHAEIEKVRAISDAMAGLGGNVRVVQLGGNGDGSTNTFMDFLMGIPEVAEVLRTKVEALSGEDFDKTIHRVMSMFTSLRSIDDSVPISGAPLPMDYGGDAPSNGKGDPPPDAPPQDE